jgi:hypothetical protein
MRLDRPGASRVVSPRFAMSAFVVWIVAFAADTGATSPAQSGRVPPAGVDPIAVRSVHGGSLPDQPCTPIGAAVTIVRATVAPAPPMRAPQPTDEPSDDSPVSVGAMLLLAAWIAGRRWCRPPPD